MSILAGQYNAALVIHGVFLYQVPRRAWFEAIWRAPSVRHVLPSADGVAGW